MGRSFEEPHIFPKRVDYKVPKAPPGPYYTPYRIDSCFTTTRENYTRCRKKFDQRKCAKNYIREMGGWNPHDKSRPPGSDVVERWSKISYLSDPLHRHRGHFELRKIN